MIPAVPTVNIIVGDNGNMTYEMMANIKECCLNTKDSQSEDPEEHPVHHHGHKLPVVLDLLLVLVCLGAVSQVQHLEEGRLWFTTRGQAHRLYGLAELRVVSQRRPAEGQVVWVGVVGF